MDMSTFPWLHLLNTIYSILQSSAVIISMFLLWKGVAFNAEKIAQIRKVLDPIARTRLVEFQSKKNKKK